MSSSRPISTVPPVERDPSSLQEIREHYPELSGILVARMNEILLSLANSHQSELIAIRWALDRMGRDVYGVCENCNDVIALDRLRLMPAARLCIDCQAANERNVLTAFPREKPTP